MLLTGVIGILSGFIIGRSSHQAPASAPTANSLVPADDGKLAREYKEQNLVRVIRENAKDIQKCYLDYLDQNPMVSEGNLTVLIKVEEDGKIGSSTITRNEFQNEGIGRCVSEKLETYYLAPPPYGINRNISHVIAFKKEETALKEARERELSNRAPKVLPVNP